MACRTRGSLNFDNINISELAKKLDNIKIVHDITQEPVPIQSGKLAYGMTSGKLYMSLDGR